jgi:DNA-binding MarR family transcriptional regulator
MNDSYYESLPQANIFFKLSMMMNAGKPRPCGAAFLLAQLGAHAAERFGERVAILGISPPHAGILRIIASSPSTNQLSLAKKLGILPSRLVILIDELTGKGLVERQRSQKDRRHSELVLTEAGREMLEKISRIAVEHEMDLCAALNKDERETLATLCKKIVAQQGLTPDVHPGYRKL